MSTLSEWYTHASYDAFFWLSERRGMAARRRAMLAGAHGRVLEIGAGTGLNLDHYPADGISDLVLLEPEPGMARKLRERAEGSSLPVRVVDASAEEMPFDDGSFDTVVSTLVLCTVPDPGRTVAEIQRVLAPGGRLLFIEHVRADDARLARWQDRLNVPWRAFADGCNCNRPTLQLLESSPLRVERTERAEWRAMPRIIRPLVVGRATA